MGPNPRKFYSPVFLEIKFLAIQNEYFWPKLQIHFDAHKRLNCEEKNVPVKFSQIFTLASFLGTNLWLKDILKNILSL